MALLLRLSSRILSRVAPAAGDCMWQLQAAPGCAAAAWQQQQLFQRPWQQQAVAPGSCEQRQGFASAVAAAEQAAAAGPAAAALPDVYVPLEDPVQGPYRVEPKRVFAVVEVGGTQYKVTPNDSIVVEKLAGVDVNDRLQLRRVLLLGSQEQTIIGRPYVPEAAVTAAVEEQFLDGKVLIFHKRRRKNSRRLRGHRQPLTTLRILDVHGIEEAGVEAAAETAGAGTQ